MRPRLALLSAALAAVSAGSPADAAQWLENHGRAPAPLVSCDLLTPYRFENCGGRPAAPELATGSVRAGALPHAGNDTTGSVTPTRAPRNPAH